MAKRKKPPGYRDRERILGLDVGEDECPYCRKQTAEFTVDHIIPKSDIGCMLDGRPCPIDQPQHQNNLWLKALPARSLEFRSAKVATSKALSTNCSVAEIATNPKRTFPLAISYRLKAFRLPIEFRLFYRKGRGRSTNLLAISLS